MNNIFTADNNLYGIDDWLTAHRSITLVDFQLDAQNSNFFKIKYIC